MQNIEATRRLLFEYVKIQNQFCKQYFPFEVNFDQCSFLVFFSTQLFSHFLLYLSLSPYPTYHSRSLYSLSFPHVLSLKFFKFLHRSRTHTIHSKRDSHIVSRSNLSSLKVLPYAIIYCTQRSVLLYHSHCRTMINCSIFATLLVSSCWL